VKTVLVVEDEFGVADLILTALEDEGFRVLKAAHGVQALERLGQEKPDLIISDFMMPIMDGPTFAAQVREMDELAGVPIIMMSAVPESALRARFDGYSAFLQKPFRIGDLVEVVGRLLTG
jgi:CheY-like chemotaxis protein